MSYRSFHLSLTVSTALILAAGCNIPCGDDGVAGAQHECNIASASESASETDSNSNTETETDSQGTMGTDSNSDSSPSGSMSDSNSDSGMTDTTAGPTDSNTDTNTNSNTDTDSNTNTDSNTDTDSNTNTDSNTDSDTNGGNLWCPDNDMDGFGDGEGCVDVPPGEDPPDGTVNNDDDCDDDDENTHPGAAENEPDLCTNDDDDDGWGDSDPPPGVDPGNDCNDNNPIIFEDCLCEPIIDGEDPVCSTPDWGYVLIDILLGTPDPEWVFSDGNDEVCEPNNGPATALVCDGWELDQDAKANVVFEVKTEADNDWIGFVFGWQDWGHFYSFTWKKGPQLVDLGNLDCLPIGTFPGGMMVKAIDAIVEGDVNCRDMHENANTLHSELIWSPGDSPDTNVGWEENTTYLFNLDMSVDQGFILTITNAETDETVAVIDSEDMTYPDGQFGIFSASQAESCFSGFASGSCE